MNVSKKLLWGSSLSLLALAACDGSGGSGGGGGGGSTAPQNQFGVVFSKAYIVMANGKPITPINQDAIVFKGVTGPDPTASPINL